MVFMMNMTNATATTATANTRRTLYGASKAERLAVRAAFIPKGARLVSGPKGGAVYSYDGLRAGAPVFYAIAFRGYAAKPEFHYSYRTVETRDAAIAQFQAGLVETATRKTARAAAKAAWTNPLTVGTVLYTSWGYDQTNVDFYAVSRVSGRRVWLRRVESEYTATGDMSGRTRATLPIRYVGAETMHTAQPLGDGGVYVKVGHNHASIDTPGQSHYTSSYA